MQFNRQITRFFVFFSFFTILESAIFQDPANYAIYGGPSANQIFQHYSSQMSSYIEKSLHAERSFERLFSDAIAIRGKAARESNTKEAELFQTLRTKEESINGGTVGSLTPVLKYPLMTKIMRQNIKSLKNTVEFTPLDDIFEYRYIELNAAEWSYFIAKNHQTEPHISASVHRIFEGKEGKGDPSTWVFDYKDGWVNGTLPMDYHFTNALLQSYQKVKQGIVDNNIKLIYVQIRFRGTDVDTRSVIFPMDATAREDLSNVPFTLIHPSLKNMPYHMKQVEAAFEDARRAIGDTQNKIRRIAKFSYLFALTMPLVRGSAAVNEWLTSGLFLYHNLIMPKKNDG